MQANLTINGTVIPTPVDLCKLLAEKLQKCSYEVQSFDCSVINTNYNVGVDESKLSPEKDGKKSSVLVLVSGTVRYWGGDSEGETRGFTETVVLVPNLDAYSPRAPKDSKRWLIQSQTFRIIS